MGSITRKMARQKAQADPNSPKSLDLVSRKIAGTINSARAAGSDTRALRSLLLRYAAGIAIQQSSTEQQFAIEAVNAYVEEKRDQTAEEEHDDEPGPPGWADAE